MKKIKLTFLAILLSPSFALALPMATSSFTDQITALASASSCANYDWADRGQAPSGYPNGMALSFARSLCRLINDGATNPLVSILTSAETGDTDDDALAYYASIFKNVNLPINAAGTETLRDLYTLGFGLGMRESSGNYCEGWDETAGSNRPSSEAEAGLFQTSYDSMTANPQLQALYTEYQATPDRCWLDVFEVDATCDGEGILGTGAGADFQKFEKACPAFSTEYAMTVLRVLRSHYGPINRQEAQVEPICENMLQSVETLVEQNATAACQELK